MHQKSSPSLNWQIFSRGSSVKWCQNGSWFCLLFPCFLMCRNAKSSRGHSPNASIILQKNWLLLMVPGRCDLLRGKKPGFFLCWPEWKRPVRLWIGGWEGKGRKNLTIFSLRGGREDNIGGLGHVQHLRGPLAMVQPAGLLFWPVSALGLVLSTRMG